MSALVFVAKDTAFSLNFTSKNGKTENPLLSACGDSIQDACHLVLNYPAMGSLRRWLLSDSPFIYILWSRSWGVARLLGFHGLLPCPNLSEGVGQQQQQQQQHYGSN